MSSANTNQNATAAGGVRTPRDNELIVALVEATNKLQFDGFWSWNGCKAACKSLLKAVSSIIKVNKGLLTDPSLNLISMVYHAIQAWIITNQCSSKSGIPPFVYRYSIDTYTNKDKKPLLGRFQAREDSYDIILQVLQSLWVVDPQPVINLINWHLIQSVDLPWIFMKDPSYDQYTFVDAGYEDNFVNSPAVELKFDQVHHDVHDVNDLLTILGFEPAAGDECKDSDHEVRPLTSNSTGETGQSKKRKLDDENLGKVTLKGFLNTDYLGGTFIWFAPHIPDEEQESRGVKIASKESSQESSKESIDNSCSRYGPFRLIFSVYDVLATDYCQFLGSRLYKAERCHAVVFSDDEQKNMRTAKPFPDISNIMMTTDIDNQWSWKYRPYDKSNAWDALVFARKEKEIQIPFAKVRMQFLKHNGFCHKKQHGLQKCDHYCARSTDAMDKFLEGLTRNKLSLSQFKSLFEDAVYQDLSTRAAKAAAAAAAAAPAAPAAAAANQGT